MVPSTLVASLRAYPPRWAALGLFTGLALLFYGPYFSHLPEGLHAWAQADRLSLALNFYDFGLDFWHPRTSSFVSIGGITGVELPLQSYLAALGGVIFGRGAIPTLFRLLDVAVAVLGFWYLFRLVYERTGNFVAGLVPGAFLLSAPTYAFYAGTFLPDPVSLSLSFVGYYYWLRFFDSQHFRSLALALLVLTLASLLKTTTALYLAAVVGITVLWACQEPDLLTTRQRRLLLVAVGASFGALGLFIKHNQRLNTAYASEQFLATIRPIANAEDYHRVWSNIRRAWLREYATKTMYAMLAACIPVVLWRLRLYLRRPRLPLLLLFAASVPLAYLFYKLLGVQLDVHDYYIICSFMPPAMLLLVLTLLELGRPQGRGKVLITTGLGLLVVWLVGSGYFRLQQRFSDDYPPFSQFYTHAWMRGGADLLRQLNVPTTARILVLDDPAPNLALVYFDRRGLTWQPDLTHLHGADLLRKMVGDSLNYVIMSPTAYQRLPERAALRADFVVLAEQPAAVLRRRRIEAVW